MNEPYDMYSIATCIASDVTCTIQDRQSTEPFATINGQDLSYLTWDSVSHPAFPDQLEINACVASLSGQSPPENCLAEGANNTCLLEINNAGDGVVSNGTLEAQEITDNANNIATNASDIADNATDIANNTTGISTNTTDIATNTTDIANNSTAIGNNATDITALQAEDINLQGQITANDGDIAANTSAIAGNTSSIADNTSDISINTAAIASNSSDIADNAADIAINAAAITAAAGDITALQAEDINLQNQITANDGDIANNASAIASNTTNIGNNATAIGNNASAIASNDTDIAALQAEDVNLQNQITANDGDIATNAGNISSNTSAIATNAGNISANTAAISSNDTDIAALQAEDTNLQNQITANDGDIATNAGNISANTSNISTNTGNISTNTGNISANTAAIASNDSDIADLQTRKRGVGYTYTVVATAANSGEISFNGTDLVIHATDGDGANLAAFLENARSKTKFQIRDNNSFASYAVIGTKLTLQGTLPILTAKAELLVGALPANGTVVWVGIDKREGLTFIPDWSFYNEEFVPEGTLVQDDGFAGVSNKDTSDKLAPQLDGDYEYAVLENGDAAMSDSTTTSAPSLRYGWRFTPTEDIVLRGAAGYFTDNSTLVEYEFQIILNGVRVFQYQFTQAQIAEVGVWTRDDFGLESRPVIVVAGTAVELRLDLTFIGGVPAVFTGDWQFKQKQDNSPPGSGEAWMNNKGRLRVNTTDDNSNDRTADLATTIPGTKIEAGGVEWDVDSVTAAGGYYEYQLSPTTRPSEDTYTFTFTNPATSNLPLPLQNGFWAGKTVGGDQPVGFRKEGNATETTGTFLAGIDIEVANAVITDDYDFVAVPPDALIGGGSQGAMGKLSISADDTTTGFAIEKLVPGLSIALNELNPGASETLEIARKESGFENRTDSVLTFDNGTRTFTIAPTGVDYKFWQEGLLYTKSASEDLVIADTEGIHFIYYEDGVLKELLAFDILIIIKYVFVAFIYWDQTNQDAIGFGDERHGALMPAAVHAYNHETTGARFGLGLALQNLSTNASGNLDSSAQLAVQDGVIHDEDIRFSITGGAPQTLGPIARIPGYYLAGPVGVWRKMAATDFPIMTTGSGRMAFNEFTGGQWQLTEISNSDFGIIFIFATTSLTEPVIFFTAQNQYTTLGNARNAIGTELGKLQLGTIEALSPELVPIGALIVQTNDNYSNPVKSRFRTLDDGSQYFDFRTKAGVGGNTSQTQDRLIAISANDTSPGDFQTKIIQGTNITFDLLNPGANEQIRINSSGGSGGGEQFKVSANDTTAGYAEDKIIPGDGSIGISTANDGADEDLEVVVNKSADTGNSIILTPTGLFSRGIDSGNSFPVSNLYTGKQFIREDHDNGNGIVWQLQGDLLTWVPVGYRENFQSVPNDADITKFAGRRLVITDLAATNTAHPFLYNDILGKWLSSEPQIRVYSRADGTCNVGDGIGQNPGQQAANGTPSTSFYDQNTITFATLAWASPLTTGNIEIDINNGSGVFQDTLVFTVSNGITAVISGINMDIDTFATKYVIGALPGGSLGHISLCVYYRVRLVLL